MFKYIKVMTAFVAGHICVVDRAESSQPRDTRKGLLLLLRYLHLNIVVIIRTLLERLGHMITCYRMIGPTMHCDHMLQDYWPHNAL